MWPSGHCGAWQYRGLRAIVPETSGPERFGPLPKRNIPSEGPNSRPPPQPPILEDLPMSDAVKVGFVAFSAAPRGVLVVFCDDALKFGAATRKVLGKAADTAKRGGGGGGGGEGGRSRQGGGGGQPVQGQERIDARYPGAGGNQGGAPDRGRC